MTDSKRYFAIVYGRTGGYVLDYYPEEERACRRELGRRIIGDYDSIELADAAVWAELRALEGQHEGSGD